MNFQSRVLILLRSVMCKHRVTFTSILAYCFRRLLKELQKATTNLVLSVYLPVHPHGKLDLHWKEICEFLYSTFILICVKNLTFVWKWPNTTGTLHEDSPTFMSVVFVMETAFCVRYKMTICK